MRRYINRAIWFVHWHIFGFKVYEIQLQWAQYGWLCQLWVGVTSSRQLCTPEYHEVKGDGRYRVTAYILALLAARRLYGELAQGIFGKDELEQCEGGQEDA
jgi:hypothetical protein